MGKEVDKDYEALLENYTDAVMRLVMYRVAQEDGKRLLQEAEELEQSGFETPPEFDEKCLKLIRENAALAERRQPSGKPEDNNAGSPRHLRLRTVGHVVAAVVLTAALLFCVAYASNDTFRVNVLNFFFELKENGTQFFFRSNDSGETIPQQSGAPISEDKFPFEFTYIPKGYGPLAQEVRNLEGNGTAFYSRYGRYDDEYCNFIFEIFPISEGTSILVDTEDANVINTEIYGYDGYIIKKEDRPSGRVRTMYLWFDTENQYSFQYCSIGISDDISQEIFDGIVIDEQLIKIY